MAEGLFFSVHFHKLKDETFYVTQGKMLLRYKTVPDDFNLDDREACMGFVADMQEIKLRPGDVFHVPTWLAHQVVARTDVTFLEFSTHHEDSDSYRITKGC